MNELANVHELYLALAGMIFMNIYDDYVLQGKLSYLKQKEWWKNNYPDSKYSSDWSICMLLHAFEWTFMVYVIPVAYTLYRNYSVLMESEKIFYIMFCMFVINVVIHFIVDDQKANHKSISLKTDVCIHIIQIVLIWLFFGFLNLL